MSILLANEIKKYHKQGKITIEPFDEKNLAINSIDVTLNERILTYVPVKIIKTIHGNLLVKDIDKLKEEKENTIEIDGNIDILLHLDKKNKYYETIIPKEGLILSPNILYIGMTNEVAGSTHFIPMYEGRSSMARLGIQSHISAGFGDLCFSSNWTLEITVQHFIKFYPNFRIGQVYFHQVSQNALKEAKELDLIYKGKYIKQNTPQTSKSYLDFEKEDN